MGRTWKYSHSEKHAKDQIHQVFFKQNFQHNQLSLYVQSAHKVDHHCLILCGVIELFNGKWVFGRQLSQKMKPETLRSKCRKKMNDDLLMGCGSKDGMIVYVQAGHIKHRKITILEKCILLCQKELGKAKGTRKRTF